MDSSNVWSAFLFYEDEYDKMDRTILGSHERDIVLMASTVFMSLSTRSLHVSKSISEVWRTMTSCTARMR